VLDDGKVQVEDASDLWGTDPASAHEMLLQRFGPDTHTAVIGRAGEHRVPYASIVHDVWFQANRTGLGAVMGSKRIKALVLTDGGGAVPAAEPDRLEDPVGQYRRKRRDNPQNRITEDLGIFGGFALPGAEAWPFSSHNFRDVEFGPAAARHVRALLQRHMLPNEQSPPGMERFRRYVVSEGQHASDPRYGSMEDGSVLALGHLTDVHETDVVLAAVEKTYRYGLDAEPLGGTLAGAMECAERGLPMPWDGVLPPLTVGDGTQMLVAIDEIAARSGRGELLALGSAAAAAALGPRYEALAMSVKGKEVPPHDVRNKPGLALAMAVGSIGPDYALVEYDWDFSQAASTTSWTTAARSASPLARRSGNWVRPRSGRRSACRGGGVQPWSVCPSTSTPSLRPGTSRPRTCWTSFKPPPVGTSPCMSCSPWESAASRSSRCSIAQRAGPPPATPFPRASSTRRWSYQGARPSCSIERTSWRPGSCTTP
jgi:aldehyde:ferredoxin oxidoreductase